MARSRATLAWAALVVTLFSSAVLVSGDSVAPPDTIGDVLGLPDGTAVTLDGVIVQNVLWPYMFVRDVWDSQTTLPVYANALVKKWWSLDISGRLGTIAGKRILAADCVRLYVDSDGQPFIMFPTGLLEPEEWPYMEEVPMGVAAASTIPPPPDPQQGDPPAPLTAPEGTIAGAKLNLSLIHI